MSDVPKGMQSEGRPAIEEFEDSEKLYRRVHPDDWADGYFEPDAIELPDMSVNRSAFGPAWWARVNGSVRFEDWAVASFKVGDIPAPFVHLGTYTMSFAAVHAPLKNNYPHTEVRCYENGQHVNGKNIALDPDVHLRWRERMVRSLRTELRPDEPSPAEEP